MENMERRFKILYVDEQLMVDLLVGITNINFDFLGVPVWENMPKDFRVMSVNYDVERRAFAVGIYHKTFPIVKTGEMLEAISDVEMVQKVINLKKLKKLAKEQSISLFE